MSLPVPEFIRFKRDIRTRISVTFDWIWAYLTLCNGTRLIAGGSRRKDSGGAMAAAITEFPVRIQHG
jgi:hypothetical protein